MAGMALEARCGHVTLADSGVVRMDVPGDMGWLKAGTDSL